AYRYKFYLDALESGDEARAGMIAMRLGQMTNEFFADANMDIEMDILREVLKMYMKDVSKDQMGPLSQKIAAKGDKGVEKYVKKVLKKSIFANKAKFEAFAANPNRSTLEKDPLFMLIMDMDAAYQKATGDERIKKAS